MESCFSFLPSIALLPVVDGARKRAIEGYPAYRTRILQEPVFFSPGEFAVRAAFSEPEMMKDRVYCVPFRQGGSDGLVQFVGRLNRAVFNFLLDFELCPDKVEFISVGLHMQYHPTVFMRYRQRRIRRFVDLFINRCRMAVQRRRVAAGLPAIPLRPAP